MAAAALAGYEAPIPAVTVGVHRQREPATINAALIVAALDENEGESGAPARPQLERLRTAAVLSLSFRHIGVLENLHSMTALRELRLDNNLISKVEGLEALTELRLLDLSFNTIKRIEGLGALSKLEELSLYNNQIEHIENLEGCASLVLLSLGNNRIDDTNEIVPLLRLRKLAVLNLDGNPISDKKAAYRSWCLAFLPRLKYMDYSLVTAAEVRAAAETGAPPDMVRMHHSAEAERRRRAAEADEVSTEHHRLGTINADHAHALGAELFEEEAETARVKFIPGLEEAQHDYQIHLSQLTTTYTESVTESQAVLQGHLSAFDEAVGSNLTDCVREASAATTAWEAGYARLHLALHREALPEMADLMALQGTLADLLGEAREVHRVVANAEIQRHKRVMALLETLEVSLDEPKKARLKTHEAFYRSVEALEVQFQARVTSLAEELASGVASGKLDVVDEDLLALAMAPAALATAVTSAHETRVRKIFRREGDTRRAEQTRFKASIEERADQEGDQNRRRLVEVREWLATALSRLETLETELNEAMEDAVAAATPAGASRRGVTTAPVDLPVGKSRLAAAGAAITGTTAVKAAVQVPATAVAVAAAPRLDTAATLAAVAKPSLPAPATAGAGRRADGSGKPAVPPLMAVPIA